MPKKSSVRQISSQKKPVKQLTSQKTPVRQLTGSKKKVAKVQEPQVLKDLRKNKKRGKLR